MQSKMKLTRDENRARTSNNVMDMWIMASLKGLIRFVHEEMKAYRLYTVVPRFLSVSKTSWDTKN